MIDYDVDSEAEWEEDEEGEECKSDDEDEDADELGSEQDEEVSDRELFRNPSITFVFCGPLFLSADPPHSPFCSKTKIIRMIGLYPKDIFQRMKVWMQVKKVPQTNNPPRSPRIPNA